MNGTQFGTVNLNLCPNVKNIKRISGFTCALRAHAKTVAR